MLPLCALLIAAAVPPASDAAVAARVARVLRAAPVIDGHNDLPWELRTNYGGHVDGAIDLRADTAHLPAPLQTDIPRLRAGGVGAQFWSVWIPTTLTGPAAVETTLEQIDVVHRLAARYPEAFVLARTAADVRRAQQAGRIASLIGVEGGHQIDGRLPVLRAYRALGVGYMTLTHSTGLDWADSSTDVARAHGLTPFGHAVVAEMNRLGMIVDLSHVSDETALAAIAASRAPVMLSHSGARAVNAVPRNAPDDVLSAVGRQGGVVMVNVFPSFVSARYRDWGIARTEQAARLGSKLTATGPDPALAKAALAAWDAAHPAPPVSVGEVADHVDHIARVAGRAAVGLGGDYDGIDGAGPEGMKGVDGYPRLLAELARRGWSDAELAALTGGNILRVMERAEAVAAALRGEVPGEETEPAVPAGPS